MPSFQSFHVAIHGLKRDSHAILPQLRAVSKKCLIRRMGKVTTAEIEEITYKLKFYLDLQAAF
ncbi:hypothetical protein HZA43_05790 [Candidatus Peregrinibacteria bacterium]|nr:hypothetical protein [Candidatus Peregrinibacteria bacterium]